MNPYRNLPRSAYWKTAISKAKSLTGDISGPRSLKITRDTAIVSAGSCFAANVTKYLVRYGFNYLFTEKLHPFFATQLPALEEKLGLGSYSAGYGNIYTPRQLNQLIQRAYGEFTPHERFWKVDSFGLVDVFRPRIEFPAQSEIEFDLLQKQHFEAVRRAFESCDLFVFTFGLTESWRSKVDGSIYPVCPGVVGGIFDPNTHEFVNFSADQIVADTEIAILRLRKINPKMKILLTVSPVPLVATASGKHVLPSTIYSKSVLRVAAEELSTKYDFVEYFPAYEIVTGPQAPFETFEKDRRSVSKDAVDTVMRCFFEAYAQEEDIHLSGFGTDHTRTAKEANDADSAPEGIGEILANAECEEELLQVAHENIHR